MGGVSPIPLRSERGVFGFAGMIYIIFKRKQKCTPTPTPRLAPPVLNAPFATFPSRSGYGERFPGASILWADFGLLRAAIRIWRFSLRLAEG